MPAAGPLREAGSGASGFRRERDPVAIVTGDPNQLANLYRSAQVVSPSLPPELEEQIIELRERPGVAVYRLPDPAGLDRSFNPFLQPVLSPERC